jgi:hypothetical protein
MHLHTLTLHLSHLAWWATHHHHAHLVWWAKHVPHWWAK